MVTNNGHLRSYTLPALELRVLGFGAFLLWLVMIVALVC